MLLIQTGGVLCLTLGSTKPDNFDEILATFDKIIKDKKHYVISVFDKATGRFMGDAELLVSHNGIDYALLSYELVYEEPPHLVIKVIRYTFNRDEVYGRAENFFKFASLNDYNSLQSQIDELKSQLTEIKQNNIT